MAQVSSTRTPTNLQLTNRQFKTTLLALVALLTSYALAVSPLVVKGSDFVNSVDDTRFQIIGVA